MSAPEPRHSDTAIVDALTAFLNRETEPCGADAIELMAGLISGSGRPLLFETTPVHAQVVEDRYGIATAVVTAGTYTLRFRQPADDSAAIRIEITTVDGDDYGLAITVDGRPVLDPMPLTWTSSVPADLQLAKEHRR